MPRKHRAPLPAHPADAAEVLSRYVQTAGFAFLAIRQALNLENAYALAPNPPDAGERLRALRAAILQELDRVDSIIPDSKT